jgi:hypothetical protein
VAQSVDDALRGATLYSDDTPYVLLSLPLAAITAAAGVVAEISEPFTALLVDKDEVTLVLTAREADEFSRRLPGAQRSAATYRLLTLDVALEPTLVGFMARVSAALAEANVPILPFAAYTRDHLLVPEDQFDRAKAALEQLQR